MQKMTGLLRAALPLQFIPARGRKPDALISADVTDESSGKVHKVRIRTDIKSTDDIEKF